jgi:hypothetical protein
LITAYNLDEKGNYDNEIKIMRACKALMFYRVIKYNNFAVKIISIANRTVPSYLTLVFLMFYVILIFAIVGMEFFINKFDESEQLGQKHSYQDVGKAWMTVFNVITNDDWYGILVLATIHSEIWIALTYCFVMIFVINYMIFGLVMAILLDAFSKELELDDHSAEE